MELTNDEIKALLADVDAGIKGRLQALAEQNQTQKFLRVVLLANLKKIYDELDDNKSEETLFQRLEIRMKSVFKSVHEHNVQEYDAIESEIQAASSHLKHYLHAHPDALKSEFEMILDRYQSQHNIHNERPAPTL